MTEMELQRRTRLSEVRVKCVPGSKKILKGLIILVNEMEAIPFSDSIFRQRHNYSPTRSPRVVAPPR